MDVLTHALGYLRAGYSIVPIHLDGTKRPAVAEWKHLQGEPPSEEQARSWWEIPAPPGIALVCGAISGGLEVIDFDREARSTFARWRTLVEESWPGLLARVCVVKTPRKSGGCHVWFRCGGIETPGNLKLARLSAAETQAERELAKAEGRKAELTLIETRGSGGYALAPGCPPECHECKALYTHVAGVALEQLHDLSADERDVLLACARLLDRDVPAPEPTPKSAAGNDLRPGDDFDQRGWDWGEILQAHGWTLAFGSAGGERRWRRPGKKAGWSATTGHCRSNGADLFRCFTTGGDPFEEGKSYGKFRAFALLNHGGDLKRAAKDLAGHQFGSPARPPSPKVHAEALPSTNGSSHAPRAAEPFPAPIPASMLKLSDPALSWIWNGFLRRGEITLMAALWKAGKTTLLAHLLRAFAQDGEFLGQPVTASRVLYVTEESESRWASRRDQVDIKDHVDFLIRPFPGKPRVERWEEFLVEVGAHVEKNKYDVVIFDTLANLWPLRDENDAAGVQACLMPLHKMIEDKAALQLVHHTRKSDGAEATASRGSGALTGFVDTIVEFRRYLPSDRQDRRRILSGYGRHDETPQELVIELGEAGYVARGDRETVSRGDLGAVITGILPPRMPGLTADQVVEGWPDSPRPSRDRVMAALKDGAEAGKWVQDGEGKRGSPFLFYMPFGVV